MQEEGVFGTLIHFYARRVRRSTHTHDPTGRRREHHTSGEQLQPLWHVRDNVVGEAKKADAHGFVVARACKGVACALCGRDLCAYVGWAAVGLELDVSRNEVWRLGQNSNSTPMPGPTQCVVLTVPMCCLCITCG